MIAYKKYRQLFLGCLILHLTFINNSYAQSFYNAYGLSGSDELRAIEILPGGDYIVGGSCATNGGDIYIARIDPTGAKVWERNYGGSRAESILASTINTNGNILFAGTTASLSLGTTNNTDIVVLEIDPNGNLQWIRDYGRNSGFDEVPFGINLTANGIGIAGQLLITGSSTPDMIAMEISNNGNTINWQQIYEANTGSIANQLISSSSGGYILIGSANSSNLYNQVLMRLNASGDITSTLAWGSSLNESTHKVMEESNGDVIVMGNYRSLSGSGLEISLTKISNSNAILWSTTYGDNGTRNERGFAFYVNSSGNYVIGGQSGLTGAGGVDGLIVEASPTNGSLISSISYGGSSDDFIYGIVQNSDQSYTMAGNTASFGAGATDANLVRTNINGTIVNNCSVINIVRRVVTPSVFSQSLDDNILTLANNSSSFTTGSASLTITNKPTCVALPIVFMKISSMYKGSEIYTEWEMADQENIKSYEVEYSHNAIDFVAFSTIAASANYFYSTTYKSIVGTYNYIRIKCYTHEGGVVYSEVIPINRSNKNTHRYFDIYPNPTSIGIVTIKFDNPDIKISKIHVSDITGKILYEKDFSLVNENLSAYTIGHLPKGIYIVTIISNEGMFSEKVVFE